MSDNQFPSTVPIIGAIFAPEFAAAASRAGIQVITGADFRDAAAAIVQHSTQIGAMFPIVVGDVSDPSLEMWVSAVAQSAPGTVGFFRDPSAPAAFLDGIPSGVVAVDLNSSVNHALTLIGVPAIAGGDVYIIDRPVEEAAALITEPALPEEQVAYLPEPVESLTDVRHTVDSPEQTLQTETVIDAWDTPVGAIPEIAVPSPVSYPVAPNLPAQAWDLPAQAPAVQTPAAPEFQAPAPVQAPQAWDLPAPSFQAPEFQTPPMPQVQSPQPEAQPWDLPPAQVVPTPQAAPAAQPFPQLYGAPAVADAVSELAPAPEMNSNPVVQSGMPLPTPAQEFAFNPNQYTIPETTSPAAQPFTGAVADDPWNTPVDGRVPQAVFDAPVVAPKFGPPSNAPRVDNSRVATIGHSAHSEVQVAGLFDGHRPGSWKGQVITSFSGKGGVGKTTCSIQLARVAAEAGLRVILIDGNVGQGDILQCLRLNTADMPTIYDIALRIQSGHPQDVMRNGVIQPDASNAARRRADPALDDLGFAIVAAAPSSVEDHRLVTNQLYNAVIDFAASNADLVILDTQIIEVGDRTNFVGEVILPLMRHGAFGVGIAEDGIAGANNLLDRLTRLNNDGIDRRQLMSLFNKVSPEGIDAADASAQYFSTLATYVGHVPANNEIKSRMNAGYVGMDDAALNATMNRILFTVTGDRRFEEAALTYAASGSQPAQKLSLFKKKRKATR